MIDSWNHLGLVLSLGVFIAAVNFQAGPAPPMSAVCVLQSTPNDQTGDRIFLTQTNRGVRLRGAVQNLKPGSHRVHVPVVAHIGDIEANGDGMANIDLLIQGREIHELIGCEIVLYDVDNAKHMLRGECQCHFCNEPGPSTLAGVIELSNPQRDGDAQDI